MIHLPLSAQSGHGAEADQPDPRQPLELLNVGLWRFGDVGARFSVSELVWTAALCLSLCRKMLTKDKKPEEKEEGKGAKTVIPPRPDTPEMFKAALKVTEQAGIEGTFAKLKKAYKPSEAGEAQVGQHHHITSVQLQGRKEGRKEKDR